MEKRLAVHYIPVNRILHLKVYFFGLCFRSIVVLTWLYLKRSYFVYLTRKFYRRGMPYGPLYSVYRLFGLLSLVEVYRSVHSIYPLPRLSQDHTIFITTQDRNKTLVSGTGLGRWGPLSRRSSFCTRNTLLPVSKDGDYNLSVHSVVVWSSGLRSTEI